MDHKETGKDGYFSEAAIAARRAEDPPEVVAAWQAARAEPHHISPKHWDGKPKKR